MTRTRIAVSLALALLAVLATGPASAAASITIVNVNAPGVGFNDPTPAAPVGGNPGTTVGQQRLNAFTQAAGIWGGTLDDGVEIFIQSSFVPLACTPTSAVLGSAGTIAVFEVNAGGGGIPPFPGLEPATWYGQALTNKRVGFDVLPGPNGTSADDIRARFNSNLGTPGCLTGIGWYYGFDGNHGTNIDLVTVLLHEFAHGLNFQSFANVSTGALFLGLDDVFEKRIFDNTAAKFWPEMTDAERQSSAVNPRKVVWTGATVTNAVPGVLAAGTPLLHVSSPASIAGDYSVGTAAFGPALSSPGVTGNVVQALDPADVAGPTTFDACSALTNGAAVAGNIALVDRGTCAFTVKVKNAQNAGAIAVIVANNVAGGPPPGLGGADPTITIPAVMIAQGDANTIKAQLGAGVVATLGVDLSVRAGADPLGRALLFTPNPVQPGSTISHWDQIAFPNQLMEPAINGDLTHSVMPPQDLTLPLLRDVGWFPDADLDGVPDDVDCEPHSNFSPTVVIGGCDSGVPNTFFLSGCTISDLVAHCAAGAGNHGAFASCVAHLTNDLKKAGVITGAQKDAIQSCAGGAAIP
jgi:hypothetical protein